MEKHKIDTGEGLKPDRGGAASAAGIENAPFLQTKDFMVSGEAFELVRVDDHGLLRTLPRPKNLAPYYRSEAYISHTDRRTTFFEKLYQGFKAFNLRGKIKLLKRLHSAPGKLLDFGSGTGDFLLAAQKAGWSVIGVEPDEGARSRSLKKGIRALARVEGLPEPSFDIITLWHVLEHLPDPGEIIASLGERLVNNEYLIIAVPNYKSFDARHYGSFWAAYDTPRHLWHFTAEAMEALLESKGFHLEEKRPMWLDAFYVSWLSEKYKRNPIAPIPAFLVACCSNMLAVFSGESSSRIYVFRKRPHTT
jgi:2-polyprenyl-3-methyl-5-hydroxy-6-metoxy-1,4-benzoquinol methylase